MNENVLRPGDVVRLKSGSNEMLVSQVLDADTIECTYFDGVQQIRASIPAQDVQKIAVPHDPNLPHPVD